MKPNLLYIPRIQLKRLLRFFDLNEGIVFAQAEENFHYFHCHGRSPIGLNELSDNLGKAIDQGFLRMDAKTFKYYLTFKGYWMFYQLERMRLREGDKEE